MRMAVGLAVAVLVAAYACGETKRPVGGHGGDARGDGGGPGGDGGFAGGGGLGGDGGSSGSGGGDPTCEAPGQVRCGGACTTLASDPRNCGACGTVCDDGFLCGGGTCLQVKDLALGFDQSCAILGGGKVRCWGRGVNRVAEIGKLEGAVQVAAGESHACALFQDGTIGCWGSNDNGQLGDGTRYRSNEPRGVQGLTGPVTQIAVGKEHSCALLEDQTLACWGPNRTGVRGDVGNESSTVAQAVPGVAGVKQVAAGAWHTCALVGDEETKVLCWGSNQEGQLSGYRGSTSFVPVELEGMEGRIVSITAGESHSCAIVERQAGREVWCWGETTYGKIGNAGQYGTPTRVETGGADATRLSLGANHSCGLFGDGKARCWGSNSSGQLGCCGQDVGSSSQPVVVSGLTEVEQIATGNDHACALLRDGTVHCWGSNWRWQAGAGLSREDDLYTPVPISL